MKSLKVLAESVGDTDRSARYGKPNSEWVTANTVYAFDYEIKEGMKSSIYVDSDSLYKHIIISYRDGLAIFRASNEGQTIKEMSSSGSMTGIPVSVIHDIYEMAASAFSRSTKQAELIEKSSTDSSDGGSSRSGTAVMPRQIKIADVIYEAVEYEPGSVSNTSLDLDSVNDLTPEDVALESFKASFISSALSGEPLEKSEYGYGTVEKAIITSPGVFDLTMSVEMPNAEDGHPKQVSFIVKVSPKGEDLISLAGEIFDFKVEGVKVKEEAIAEAAEEVKPATTTEDII